MALLKCDVCEGTIAIQSGGSYGVCGSCGASYTLERMREITSGIKVSITGTKEDVEQWKSLLKTYLSTHDFEAAEKITKKILEAVPGDVYANEVYLKLGDWKYHDIRNGVLVKYNGRGGNVVISNGISEIGASAFESCGNLSSISLPNSLVKICGSAFMYCNKLTRITIPDSVTFIGDSAFLGCSALSEVIIPNSVTHVGIQAFSSCGGLEKLTLSNQLKQISPSAFYSCPRLSNVILHEGLAMICNKAFAHCHNITSITIPRTCTAVGVEAFEGCRALSKVIILGRNTKIQVSSGGPDDDIEYVFFKCENLTDITYPDGCGYTINVFNGTPYAVKERARRKELGLCIACGGEIRGIFNRVCTECGLKQL